MNVLLHYFRSLYCNPRLAIILGLGFFSGLPLALTFGTLSVWLHEVGINKSTIGLFALAGLPYSLKYFWSPLLDRLSIPGLTSRWGQRRSWIAVSQGMLAVTITGTAMLDPTTSPQWIAVTTLMTAFFSATQDIVIDAYRVELLETQEQGIGAALAVFGYRLGMLVSGAGALYLATFTSWGITYHFMAIMMLAGTVLVWFAPDPHWAKPLPPADTWSERIGSPAGWVKALFFAPLNHFNTSHPLWLILALVILYKLGDAVAGMMTTPFYLEMGFSKIDIASVSKGAGLVAVLLGGFLGGEIVKQIGIMTALWWCGLVQMLSNLLFILLGWASKSHILFWVAVMGENLSGGMGTIALVAFLSGLCRFPYTATQYALLSSLAALAHTFLGATGGFWVEQVGWTGFFFLSTLAAMPGLVITYYLGYTARGKSTC